MKILLHCGAYKTGSSSIQNYFYKNRAWLMSEHGVFYPTAGIYFSKEIGYRHTKLFYSFGKKEWVEYIEAMRSQLLQAKKSGARVAVISCEALSNPALHPSLKEFLKCMHEWGFDDVEGVLYIRNWYDYVVRHYREFTFRHGNKKKITEWVSKNSEVFDYPNAYCNLNNNLDGRLSCLVYEEVGSVLEDFCSRVAIPNIESNAVRVNEGVKPIDIEFSRICNIKKISKNNVIHSEDVDRENA